MISKSDKQIKCTPRYEERMLFVCEAVIVVAFEGKLFIKRVNLTLSALIKVPSNWRK